MPARELSPRPVGEYYDPLGTGLLLPTSLPLPPLSADVGSWPVVPDASLQGWQSHSCARSLSFLICKIGIDGICPSGLVVVCK